MSVSVATSGNVNYISTLNSSSTPLGPTGTYTGSSEDVLVYKSATVSVFTDEDSGANGLSLQFSTDNVNWDFTYDFDIKANIAQSQTVQCPAKYFRVVYENGPDAQGEFRLQSTLGSERQFLSTNDAIQFQHTKVVGNVEGTNTISTLSLDNKNNVNVSIKGPSDSFGNVSVTQQQPSVTSHFYYDNIDLLSVGSTGGSSEIVIANQSAILSTGITPGSSGSIRSIDIHRYLPGTGIKALLTATFSTGGSGSSYQILGIGNSENGYFFGYNGANFSILRRNRNVDTYTNQSEWNIDKYDGTGISGITLDPSKGNIYFINMQWLGYGLVNFGIQNPETGNLDLVHSFKFPNTLTIPHIGIPIMYTLSEISNGTSAIDINMKITCMTIYNEGNKGYDIGRLNGHSVIAALTEPNRTILHIKNKLTFNGDINYIPIIILFTSIGTNDNTVRLISIEKNNDGVADLTGWTDVDTTNSVVEYIDGAVVTPTAGQFVAGGVMRQQSGVNLSLRETEIILNPGETLSVTNRDLIDIVTVTMLLTWRELM